MDPLIEMVNRHADELRHEAMKKQTRKNLAPIFIAAAVAMSSLFFTLVGLMHPGLGVPLMVISLMLGCYYLGGLVRAGRAVR